MYLFKRTNGIYYLGYEERGKPKRVSTGKKFKQEALAFLRNFNEQLEQRAEEKTVSVLLKDFIDQFLKYSEGVHTVKTRKAFMVTFRMLERHFGNVKLTEITTQALERFFSQRIKEASVYAARRDHINLSSAFNKAVRDKQLKENPCKGIGKLMRIKIQLLKYSLPCLICSEPELLSTSTLPSISQARLLSKMLRNPALMNTSLPD